LSLTVLPSSLLSSMPMSIQHQLFNASTFLLFFHGDPPPFLENTEPAERNMAGGWLTKVSPKKSLANSLGSKNPRGLFLKYHNNESYHNKPCQTIEKI
jgi:hypothetical protein